MIAELFRYVSILARRRRLLMQDDKPMLIFADASRMMAFGNYHRYDAEFFLTPGRLKCPFLRQRHAMILGLAAEHYGLRRHNAIA